jgi:glycine/D-amino acid oxidase-like deaminating enzyme
MFDDRLCGWEAMLPPPPPARRLVTEQRVNAAVIGAGLTGLAAARRLATLRPGWRIALVEAGRAGAGASGRAAGFLPDAAEQTPPSGLEAGAAQRLAQLRKAGLERLRERVREDGIACGWNETGWIRGATGAAEAAALERLGRRLRQAGEPYEELDARALAALTGSPAWRAGLRAGGPTVQPAALARGLAANLPGNVELYEESPVRRVQAGVRPRLEAEAGGAVICDRLLVAADGRAPGLGLLRRRILPLLLFLSLTRRLTPGELAALGSAPEWAVADEDLFGASFRRTGDGRLLVCGTLVYRRHLGADKGLLAGVREAHRRLMASRFPGLAAPAIETTWPGVLAVTRSGSPGFGKVGENLFAAAGFGGSGLALSTICGELLADLALGMESDLLRHVLALPGPGWLPPEPLLGWGVRALLRGKLRSKEKRG